MIHLMKIFFLSLKLGAKKTISENLFDHSKSKNGQQTDKDRKPERERERENKNFNVFFEKSCPSIFNPDTPAMLHKDKLNVFSKKHFWCCFVPRE